MIVKEACGAATLTASSTSAPAMTNTVTVGAETYQVFEKVANIGARSSTGTAALSQDLTFTSSMAADCPVDKWKLKSSLTAGTNLAAGDQSEAATESFKTDAPAIITWYYTVSTKAVPGPPVSKTVIYKIAVCGIERVAVSDDKEVKITKYYNEYKKDYDNLKYYAESIYSTWFSLETAKLVADGLVATAAEANMFEGCPLNDYMLCEDEDCEEAHKEKDLFYLDYQTKAKITSDGTLKADGTEPPAANRRILAETPPPIPYTNPSFNITKVTVRDSNAKYSRIVMKIDTVYSQTAFLAAVTTGYATGVRKVTIENKCGLEYVYPDKASYDMQL